MVSYFWPVVLYLFTIHKFYPFFHQEDGELFPADESGKILYSDVDYLDTWKALEPLVSEGLVRSLGVSNFNAKQVKRLLEHAVVKPVVNQVSFIVIFL